MKQYLLCLPECLFIQQLFLLFLRTIILFWCFKVHRLTLILPTKCLRLSGLACRSSCTLHHQEYWQYQKYLLKLLGDYQLSKCSKFRLSEGTAVYRKFKSSNFTKNKNLELVLEHNAKALSTLLLDFLIFLCSFMYRESSELEDRRYDSQKTFKKFRYKCFKCLFLANISITV